MKKKINKIEEMNEEVKVEELTEETLDTVDGGCWKNPDRDFCLDTTCRMINMTMAAYDLGVEVALFLRRCGY